MRSKLLIASICGALLAGSGMAVAQIIDDPPGSVFQTQGNREEMGIRGVPSPYLRAAGAQFRAARAARAYAYVPPHVVRHHKVVRHHR